MGAAVIPDLPGLVEARIQAECSDVIRQIGGAAAFDSAVKSIRSKPAVFVIPLAERPNEPPTAAQFSQLVEVASGIVIAVSNKADSRGDASRESLIVVRRAVSAALLGWVPAGCLSGLAFGGGHLLRLEDGLLWWQDDYVTTYQEVL